MSKGRDRSIYFKNGKWHNKRNDAGKASSVHDTQQDAVDEAKRMLGKQGGGELAIMRQKDGKIRSKDTIKPGNDPCPPKDKEH